MAELGKSFEGANTIEHAILSSHDIVVPLAEMPDGENFLTYVSYEDAAAVGGVHSELTTMPAAVIESYTQPNHIGLANLSPEGMENYMVGAAHNALQALPSDVAVDVIRMGRDEVIVPDPESPEREGWVMPENGIDIREIVQIQSGQMHADDAHEMLVHGDLPDHVAELLNSAGLNVDTDQIKQIHQQASLARDLPGYAHEIGAMVSNPALIEKHGLSADQVEAVLDTLSGEAPPPIPGNDPALDIAVPQQ